MLPAKLICTNCPETAPAGTPGWLVFPGGASRVCMCPACKVAPPPTPSNQLTQLVALLQRTA